MEEYARRDLFNAVGTNPGFADVTSIDFDVLEELTGVHAGSRQRAADNPGGIDCPQER